MPFALFAEQDGGDVHLGVVLQWIALDFLYVPQVDDHARAQVDSEELRFLAVASSRVVPAFVFLHQRELNVPFQQVQFPYRFAFLSQEHQV